MAAPSRILPSSCCNAPSASSLRHTGRVTRLNDSTIVMTTVPTARRQSARNAVTTRSHRARSCLGIGAVPGSWGLDEPGRLEAEQAGVVATGCQQFGVAPLFRDPPVGQDADAIGMPDAREPV